MFNPPPPTSTTPPTNNTSLPSSLPTIPRHKDKNNAYIAGIVVGTVAGIVIVVGLTAWIFYRRKRTLRLHEMPGESSQKQDVKSKRRELPVEPSPAELPDNQCPAELQGNGQNEDATTLAGRPAGRVSLSQPDGVGVGGDDRVVPQRA
jgi:hypothetical protein